MRLWTHSEGKEMTSYAISKDPNIIIWDDWYCYTDLISAQDAAEAEARSSHGDTWYVLEITPKAVFKATSVTTVNTEVM